MREEPTPSHGRVGEIHRDGMTAESTELCPFPPTGETVSVFSSFMFGPRLLAGANRLIQALRIRGQTQGL